jgi:hypothetical protein
MSFTDVVMEKFDKFEEDSAVLKGHRNRANDLGYTTVGEALNALAQKMEQAPGG